MHLSILTYLSTQRIGVLAVEMPDGSPHAATLHFAHSDEPFVFYFKTHREYRKAEALFHREVSRASFVVGADESNMKTLQMDGEVRLLREEERQDFESVFLGKFPEKVKHEDPSGVPFIFTPNWWRWTDWHTPEGKKIVLSTDEA